MGILLEAQVEVERRLRAEAKKLADTIKKAWDEAEAKTRAEIKFRVNGGRKAREAAEAKLECARAAREEAERRAQETIDIATDSHREAISLALAEMMARVRAEQQAVTEQWVRAAAEGHAHN